MTTTEQRAKLEEMADDFLGDWIGEYDPDVPHWITCKGALAAALAACAREAKLEQAGESEQALLAARKFVRGRHSVLTYGPRVLLEQLDLALLRITKLRLELSGERVVGESK